MSSYYRGRDAGKHKKKRGRKNPVERRVAAATKKAKELGLMPLDPKLELMLEDSWRDNEDLYRSLK